MSNRDLVLSHLRLIKQWQELPRFSAARREVLAKLNEQRPQLNGILRDLGPDLGQIGRYTISERVTEAPVLSYLLDLLADSDVMESSRSRLEGVPALPLTFLDLVVWEAAKPLWEDQRYRLAVNEAANHVNEFAQKRLGRTDISDTKLMGEAFSGQPPDPGKPRLRCPGDQKSETVRSQQAGAVQFSQGVFLAIRNPAHHLTGDWNPVTASEFLASLSTVARWIRTWNLAIYVPPPPDLVALQRAAGGLAQSKRLNTAQ